jgi:hypothetical protein
MPHIHHILLALLGALAMPGAAWAQSPLPACPPGNLLAGRGPIHWQNVRGKLAQMTDNAVAPEGAVWDAPVTVILETGASTVTYDLGSLVTLNAVTMQADANDQYHVWGSVDGAHYQLLGRVETVEGHGLRSRQLGTSGALVRFLRFGEGVGDKFYSFSELQAFCEIPTPFPPRLNVVHAPAQQAAQGISTYWNNTASARWELVLALIGLAYFAWRKRQALFGVKRRDAILAVLGVISLGTYFNFGFFHFNRFFHDWEWTHYYVGAKYFPEVGYERLYECIGTADTEEGLRRRVELRKITNLRTNVLENTSDVLAHPERCKNHFTSERWDSFKRDVRFFRDRQSAQRWDDLTTDHGYNATPVWNIAGHLLSSLGPASNGLVLALGLADPLYFLGMVAVLWWAFGWRVAAVGLLVIATNFPSRYYWTGGAFLRWDWLFYLVASVCCLRRDKPLLGGMALGYATLLRVFPVFMFVGPLLGAIIVLVREKRLDRAYLRFFAGGALAVALLVPVSFEIGHGASDYSDFVRNTLKHKETPLTNHMGLRTVVAYRPSEAGRVLYKDKNIDPWGAWKASRLRGFKEAKPVYAALMIAFLVLIGLAVREKKPHLAVALSIPFIAVGVELTCYYYAFLIGMAVLHEEDELAGPLLLACTAFTQFVDWAPLPGMPGGLDEKYTLMSVGTLAVFAVLLWRFASSKRPARL